MDFSSPARRGTAPVRTLVAQAAALALLLGSAAAQAAPTVYLSDDTTLDYSLTLSYAASVRTSAAAAEYLADLNNDDATRNFKKGGLINNRASALGEVRIKHKNLGFMARGTGFYDSVYRGGNQNDSLSTVNKIGSADEFVSEIRKRSG